MEVYFIGVFLRSAKPQTCRVEKRRHAAYLNRPERVGEPEDITGAAVFLASGASDFVTGKYIQVEGGRHAGDMAWSPKT